MLSKKKKPKEQTRSIQIEANHSIIQVEGDIVGRDKITATNNGVSTTDLTELVERFAQIRHRIDIKSENQADKAKLGKAIKEIEREVKKGEKANLEKLEHWLRFLASIANDIFQVTVATLTSPIAGITKAIQLIAQKAKEEAALSE
ncbi:MAG: hypothetical protein JW779_00925 [Candidatus Thorarchaeota archaeon]|nr:hypothetical protein [Candidatus Thorarchaeota archaeon]